MEESCLTEIFKLIEETESEKRSSPTINITEKVSGLFIEVAKNQFDVLLLLSEELMDSLSYVLRHSQCYTDIVLANTALSLALMCGHSSHTLSPIRESRSFHLLLINYSKIAYNSSYLNSQKYISTAIASFSFLSEIFNPLLLALKGTQILGVDKEEKLPLEADSSLSGAGDTTNTTLPATNMVVNQVSMRTKDTQDLTRYIYIYIYIICIE